MAIAALLAMPAAGALAQSPTSEQYDPRTQQVAGGVAGGGAGGSGEGSGALNDRVGTLPFTGLEVSFLALIGLALAGGGFLLFRVSRLGST